MDFYVKNSVPANKPDVVSTRIGIRNTTERLKLQYGNNYTLNIEENGIFSVHLQLQLKRL
jgi:sensor histidine kinase YesM